MDKFEWTDIVDGTTTASGEPINRMAKAVQENRNFLNALPADFELQKNKNAAGGYAGLDENLKIHEEQIPDGVAKVTDIPAPVDISGKEDLSNKNKPNGYAGLDSYGKLPNSYLHITIPHTTVSGYPVTLTDHAEGENVINYHVYGNSVQDGTPTPETPIEIQSVGDLVTDETSEYYGKYAVPVTVCGKNYCPNDWEAGFISVTTGTNQSNSTYVRTKDYFTLDNSKKYYISSDDIETNTAIYWYFYDKDKNFISRMTSCKNRTVGASETTVIIPSETTFYRLSINTTDINIKVQIEEGATATAYEPYAGETKHIYLDEPLRMVGDCADYVDFKNQKAVRQVEVLDDSGTKTIDESLGILSTPTKEDITVPYLSVPNSESVNIFVGTTISPSSIDLTYYQDINKIITNLTNAILAQGGNV